LRIRELSRGDSTRKLVPTNIIVVAYSSVVNVLFNRNENLKSELKLNKSSENKLEQPKPLKKSLIAVTLSRSTKLPTTLSTIDRALLDKKKRNKSKATGQLKTINWLLKRNFG
jgi:hypothetical protein